MVVCTKGRRAICICLTGLIFLIDLVFNGNEERQHVFTPENVHSYQHDNTSQDKAMEMSSTSSYNGFQFVDRPTQHELNVSVPAGDCGPLKFESDSPLQLTALASTPGSGNTWLRHLLQQATGIYTGSEYVDKGLKKSGFHGEGRTDSQVLGIKTHELHDEDEVNYDRVILLVRHLQGSILSEFNRRYSLSSHTGHAPEHLFNETKWKRHVTKAISYWRKFTQQWLEFKGPLLVTYYENLKDDLRSQMLRILDFLGRNITEERLECVIRNSQGKHKRDPKTFSLDPFTDSMKEDIERAHLNFITALEARLNNE